MEKGIALLNENGRFGMITPNKYCTLDYGEKIRKLIIENHSLIEIVDVSQLKIFPKASVYPYLTFINKKYNQKNRVSIKICDDGKTLHKLKPKSKILQKIFNGNNKNIGYNISLNRTVNEKTYNLFLKDVCKVQSGTTGFMALETKKCVVDNAEKGLDFIVTGNIDRYSIKLGNVRYMKKKYKLPKLIENPEIITRGRWNLYNSKKIVIGGMTKILEAAFDSKGVAVGVGVYCLTDFKLEPYFILGILNSKFATYYFRKQFEAKHLAGNYLAINVSQLERIPFPDNPDQKMQTEIIKNVDLLLQLNSDLQAATLPEHKDQIKARIGYCEDKIDAIVYELYELSEKEISIIEDVNTKK
jgi:hypothetical protein